MDEILSLLKTAWAWGLRSNVTLAENGEYTLKITAIKGGEVLAEINGKIGSEFVSYYVKGGNVTSAQATLAAASFKLSIIPELS